MTHAGFHLIPTRTRSAWAVLIAGLLALAAAAAIVLVLMIGNDATGDRTASAAGESQAITPPAGGPDESVVAAAVGERPSSGPQESHTAAWVAAGSDQPTTGPDESRTAASISRR
jgi:hypothetical protein